MPIIKKNRLYIILLSIILLGIFLRIYGLTSKSIWFDEACSISLAEKSLFFIYTYLYSIPPLHSILLKYWMNLFGRSEFAVRFLSVIFGVLSILFIYKVGEILFDRKVGLYSAFILSISSFHIFYSQEARPYSLLAFLTLLSVFLFIKILKENKFSLWALYLIVNILLVYTHLFGFFVLLFQNLCFFLVRRPYKPRWIAFQSIILVAFLPWFLIYIKGIDIILEYVIQWIPKPNISSLLRTFETFSYGGQRYGGWDFTINTQLLHIPKVLSYIFFLLFILGLTSLKKEAKDKSLILLLWLFIPIITAFLFSIVFFPVYIIRFVIFSSLAYYILIARGINFVRTKYLQATIILAIVFPAIFSLNVYYNQELKIPWKKVIEYIDTRIQPEDIIVVSPAKQKILFGYYTDGPAYYGGNKKLEVNGIEVNFVWENKLVGIRSIEDLKKIAEDKNFFNGDYNLWVIITRWCEDPKLTKDYFDDFYVLKQKKYFDGISIYQYTSL